MITIVLDGPPMGKGRLKLTVRNGHAAGYTPERTLTFEARLAAEAQHVMNGAPLLDGPLLVEVVAYMAVAESKPKKWKAAALAHEIRPTKKPDFDNVAKMLDALNLIVWGDDAQIVDGGVKKFYSDRPRLVVRVTPITEPQMPPAWSLPDPQGLCVDLFS